ncbi:MAG: hypothetical protein ACI4DK_13075, partial [Lachnospiraceae bacterium]
KEMSCLTYTIAFLPISKWDGREVRAASICFNLWKTIRTCERHPIHKMHILIDFLSFGFRRQLFNIE